MTLTEAAQFLRLSPEGLRRHAFAGTIPGWQIGTAWRFSRTALMQYLGPLGPVVEEEPEPEALVLEDTTRRPRGVGRTAERRMVGSAIGRVDVWIWRGSKPGVWYGRVGGPKPSGKYRDTTYAAVFAQLARVVRATYGAPMSRPRRRARFAILARDNFTCRYCGRKAPNVELVVDHVVPIAAGGTNDDDNLVAACVDCNAGKSDL